MHDVARVADLSRGTVYRYFPDVRRPATVRRYLERFVVHGLAPGDAPP